MASFSCVALDTLRASVLARHAERAHQYDWSGCRASVEFMVEIPWTLIERVEQFGPLITITGSNARRMTFAPVLLRDGARLKRSLLLRLPSQVLIGKLSRDQQRVLRTGFFMPDAGLSGTLHTHPHRRWRVL